MQNSQTLKDLANSAKANQDEFNNTLIEIHKQSVSQIEQDLKNSYRHEINEIKNDIKNRLSPTISEIANIRSEIIQQVTPSLTEKIFNGLVLSIAMISLCLGFLACFWLNRTEIQYYQSENERLREENKVLNEWQIPVNYRTEQANKTTGKAERYLVLPPQTLSQMKDGTQYLQLNYGGL